MLFLMRSLTLVSLTDQSLDERRDERIREEEHVPAVIQTGVHLVVPRKRQQDKRHEAVSHENEGVKLEKDPG